MLEKYLRQQVESKNKDDKKVMVYPEYRIAVQGIAVGGIHIIIHPLRASGETIDLIVSGNKIEFASA